MDMVWLCSCTVHVATFLWQVPSNFLPGFNIIVTKLKIPYYIL